MRTPHLAAAAALTFTLTAPLLAGDPFYREVARDGRIHVFADETAFTAWNGGGTLPGASVKPGYGPRGETVVFFGGAAQAAYDTRVASASPAERAAEPPPAPAPGAGAPPPAKIWWEDGKTHLAMDNFHLSMANRLQMRLTNEMPDSAVQLPGTEAAGDSRPTFRVRRAKTELEGWVWTKDLRFELQLSWAGPEPGASTNTPLEDASLTYDISHNDAFRVQVGQFKVPLGRQEMTSSGKMQFLDRDILSFDISRGRDVGIELNGLLLDNRIEYHAGVFNGNAASRITNDNAKLQYNAHLVFQPLGEVGWSEADFESKDHPLVAIGGEFENNNLFGATNATDFNTTIYGLYGIFKFKGISAWGEHFWRKRETESSPDRPSTTFHANGWHAQAGVFLIRDTLELAFRYATIDPTDAVDNNDRKEIGGAISYYIRKHRLKVQADFRQLEEQAFNQKNRELRIHTQLIF